MSQHRIVITPDSVDRNYWSDLWKYRGLFFFLAWRDIIVRYKQTVVGIAWSVLRPLVTLMIMAFIGWLFESQLPGNIPRLLLVGAATLPWSFFSTAFEGSANSLVANSNLLSKVYFPRLIVPTSTVIVSLIDFLIAFAILVALMVTYQFLPDIRILMLPVFLLLALIAALGSGLLIAALNVKFRDFRHIIPFIVQFGLYVSPIAFSSADIHGDARIPSAIKVLYSLNPMVSVIDGFRWSLLRGETHLYWQGFLPSVAISLLMLFFGIRYFRRTERGFADVI